MENRKTTQTSKPGGRPRMSDGEARSELVAVRMTVSERGMLDRMARGAGLSPSDYIRRSVLGRKTPAPNRAADDAWISELNRLCVEVSRIGNNVNQLARATHRGSDFMRFWQEIGKEIRVVNIGLKAALEQILKR